MSNFTQQDPSVLLILMMVYSYTAHFQITTMSFTISHTERKQVFTPHEKKNNHTVTIAARIHNGSHTVTTRQEGGRDFRSLERPECTRFEPRTPELGDNRFRPVRLLCSSHNFQNQSPPLLNYASPVTI